jgi:hypothetical protein
MGTSGVNMEIDLEKIQAEIGTLSQEELVKELLAVKTRQKVNQKKYHDPEVAKKSRLKKQARIKAMEDKVRALGLYDQVLKQANDAADEELGAAEAVA